jgi:hypothetical protein
MQKEAAKYGMKIGLKNSLDIVNNLASTVDFAVNEQCAELGECQAYAPFFALNKPVFHIEYPTPFNNQAAKGVSCTAAGVNGTSTILKDITLNGPTYYCDGSFFDTPVLGGTSPPRPTRSARPPVSKPPTTSKPSPTPRPSSSRVVPPPRPSTTTWPSPSLTRPTTTQRPPTSTPGGGNGGCRSKHWDQCGGNDWKGCTICEASFKASCLGLSLTSMCVVVAVYVQGRVATVLLSVSLSAFLLNNSISLTPIFAMTTAGCHIRANMTWMLDNGRSFSASEEPTNVTARLRQWSVNLSTESFLDPCRFRSYVISCSRFMCFLCMRTSLCLACGSLASLSICPAAPQPSSLTTSTRTPPQICCCCPTRH